MYSVSQAYLDVLDAPIQDYRLTGSVGSVLFSEDNIISLTIDNQISEGSEVKIGSVYVGELNAVFSGLNIPRGTWVGKVITLAEGLLVDPDTDTFEDVPLGVYTIAEAQHTLEGVSVTAYDAMADFDKSFSIDQTNGSPYDLLSLACSECGVTLGNTQAEIESLPNGTETFYLYSENDIETWRDFVSWIAQTLASVATIDRTGKLVLRQYSMTSSMTIDEEHRFSGCAFSDFSVKYTGASCVDIQNNTTRYTYVEPDNGLTYNLGSNPFLQAYGSDALQQNIIDDFSSVILVPFSAQMLGGAVYDLGDCLTFTGGVANGATCGVMGYSYTYNGGYKVEGYGMNPALAKAQSKSDKDIAGLLSRVADEIVYYDYINSAAIHIGDGETKKIVDIRYVTIRDTHIDFHAEIKHTNDSALTVKATYLLNGEPYYYEPEQVEASGVNLLHLLLPYKEDANTLGRLIVRLTADGGDIDIEAAEILAYLAGYGMGAGEIPWDGNIDIEDIWENVQIPTVEFDETSVEDAVVFNVQVPMGATLAETFVAVQMPQMQFDDTAVSDAVTVAFVIYTATIDTSSQVVRNTTYTTIENDVFELRTEYVETSESIQIDAGYCTKVTPFVTGLTVDNVVVN